VPKIANIEGYRRAIAPHVKRRLVKEPEVARFVNIKDPVEQKLVVPWDDAHLLHYIQTAEDFAHWYTDHRERSGMRKNNLIAILARIQAVHFAANFPQQVKEGHKPFFGLTSKQRFAVDTLERLTNEGHKTIFYAHNPGLVELISRELNKRGIDNMTLHGDKPIGARTKELNSRFRFGDCPNLLATLGCVQAGLNLWQADRGLFYDRDWMAKTEMQALRRMLRPQQKRDVLAYYLELPGSIDSYQDQMVSFKKTTAVSGLDWGTPDNDDVEFLHLDTILGRFCTDIAAMRGVERHKLREYLEQEIYLEAA
jgi:SNF2 family DNA or RNA helicase